MALLEHLPVNHSLRPLYRGLAFASGAYLLTFGVVGAIASSGDPLFEAGAARALGLRTNPAFAYGSLIAGALILLAVLIGRNVDRHVNMLAGLTFMLVPSAMMFLMRTENNVLNFTMATCVVSYLIGSILFTAALYTKTGTEAQARATELAQIGAH